jgi:predicted helicase
MRHFLKGDNVGLVTCRQAAVDSWELVNITKYIVESSFVSNRTKEIGYVFPLYLHHECDKHFADKRKANLNETIIAEISRRIELPFADESEIVNRKGKSAGSAHQKFTPIDILDYIYAALHSPAYREKYREFLKIDFPRVPYPRDAAQFRALAALGAKLRRLHLMEDVEPRPGMADFPIDDGNEIENIHYVDGKVFINGRQYFDHVPPEAWNFYVGGYQPAQKWLKDRKGRKLSYDDIRHYQRIIRVLQETGEIMCEVDSKW